MDLTVAEPSNCKIRGPNGSWCARSPARPIERSLKRIIEATNLYET